MIHRCRALAGDSREHLLDVGGLAAGGPKIRVHGLRRRSEASGEEILRGVDLDVPRGVVMGVIGPSGSGKSTLLRALNRLWEPAPGAVTLDGADICGLDVLALRRRVGMLFQLPAMFHGTHLPFKCSIVDFNCMLDLRLCLI